MRKKELPERVFYHLRDKSCEQGRREFQTRVGIPFNEPDLKSIIDEKIKSEDFKTELPFGGIDFAINSSDAVSGLVLHFAVNIIEKVKFLVRQPHVEVSLELIERNFVSGLKFAVLLTLFLDRIVSEVDKLVLDIFGGVFFAGCANIALLVPICSLDTIHRGD